MADSASEILQQIDAEENYRRMYNEIYPWSSTVEWCEAEVMVSCIKLVAYDDSCLRFKPTASVRRFLQQEGFTTGDVKVFKEHLREYLVVSTRPAKLRALIS